MLTLKENENLKLTSKSRVDFSDWKFWYKFILGSITLLAVLVPSMTVLIDIVSLKNQVNHQIAQLMSENKDTNLSQIMENITKNFGYEQVFSYLSFRVQWISSVNENGQVIWNDQFQTITASANIWMWFLQSYLTFFTMLSNIAVALWLLIAAFNPKKEGVSGYLSTRSTMIVVSYITITMLIAMCFLLPMAFVLKEPTSITPPDQRMANLIRYDSTNAIELFYLHLIGPVLFNIYVFVFSPKTNVDQKTNYFKKNLWIGIIILACYGIYTLIKGEIFIASNYDRPLLYPYFFFFVHETINHVSGIVWFLLAMCIIIGIYLGWSKLCDFEFKRRALKLEKTKLTQ